MCLTLRNAVAVLDHQDGRSPAAGYTRTRHHIGHLDPGDWWFPGPDSLPHTVTGVHSRDGRIVFTDQYGSNSHPGDVVVSTAVPDPRILTPQPQPRRGGRDEPATGTRAPAPPEGRAGRPMRTGRHQRHSACVPSGAVAPAVVNTCPHRGECSSPARGCRSVIVAPR